MKKLLLIKIGGGVITDKNIQYGLKLGVLKQIVGEIAEARRKLRDTHMIIGNGAGSFAHFSAKKYGTAQGFTDEAGRVGAGWVRYDAVKLDQIVLEELLKVKVPAFSFSASSMMRVRGAEVEEILAGPVEDALEKGLVPLFYGDPVIDSETGSTIFSTERVFDELVIELSVNYGKVRVIHVSSEEGVMIGGKVFNEIKNSNFEQVRHDLSGSNGVDVTGGMLHKVEACLGAAAMGIDSMIVSGLMSGRVKSALIGNKVVGTRICN